LEPLAGLRRFSKSLKCSEVRLPFDHARAGLIEAWMLFYSSFSHGPPVSRISSSPPRPTLRIRRGGRMPPLTLPGRCRPPASACGCCAPNHSSAALLRLDDDHRSISLGIEVHGDVA
jgi:hypothetical protein